VGRGRAGPSGKPCSTPSCLVSIPSEVGRGRAPSLFCQSVHWAASFQSPRRWGGVGLGGLPRRRLLALLLVSIPSEVGRGRAHTKPIRRSYLKVKVSIPSEVGRGRALLRDMS